MLTSSGTIDGFRAGRLADGDWSVWLEDEHGERHNFVLGFSSLDASVPKPQTANVTDDLFIDSILPHGRPGENTETVRAEDYIERNYKGNDQAQLLEKLVIAKSGRSLPDGTVEQTRDGAVIRLVSSTPQVSTFRVELKFYRR